MQARTSTCQPAGFPSLWTEGLGLQASWRQRVCRAKLERRSHPGALSQLLTLPSPNQGQTAWLKPQDRRGRDVLAKPTGIKSKHRPF